MKKTILFFLSLITFNLSGQSSQAFVDLGIIEFEKKNFQKADHYFGKALELDQKDDFAYFNRGFSKLALSDYKNAIINFDFAIEFTENDSIKAWSYFNKAYLFRNTTEEINKALINVNYGLEIDSMSWKALHLKGLIFHDMKDYDRAILVFDKSLFINPLNPLAYYDRGICKRKTDLIHEAINDYDQAIRLDSNYTDAFNNRGFAKTIAGDLQGALNDFNKSLKLDVNSYSYNNRGYVKFKIGDYKGAKKDCELAIKLDKENSWAYHYLGLIYYELGDKIKACELFHQSLNLGKEEVEKDIFEKCQ